MGTKRILFAGYAPVHFLCFRPVYDLLLDQDDVEVWLSGGFARPTQNGQVDYHLEGFYEPFGVDPERILPIEQAVEQPFDVHVSAHSSTDFVPHNVGRTVQIFHGVSFKNFSVRERMLEFDVLCVPGRYHAERFSSEDLLGRGSSRFLLTGFPKLDRLVDDPSEQARRLRAIGLDPNLPTVLYAPTGGKHNSLDVMGKEIVAAIGVDPRWNVLVKPHDHPKKVVNWFEALAPLENERLRVVRDLDVVPLLSCADVLLTDASSVSMEYTLLDRPIVFVDVPKLLANVKKRGGALDLTTYGREIGVVAATVGDVVPALADSLANPQRESTLRRKAAEHLFHEPGQASQNVAAVVLQAAGLLDNLPAGIRELNSHTSIS